MTSTCPDTHTARTIIEDSYCQLKTTAAPAGRTKNEHMKLIFYTFLYLCFAGNLQAQNVGIGVANATRARLEVWGAAGNGTTSGLFGGEAGISLHRNFAGVGFNQYVDNTNFGRYMGNGYALLWLYRHNDLLYQDQGFSLQTYTAGTANALLSAPTTAWNFSTHNRWQILPKSTFAEAVLDVSRGTGGDGTAMFQGTTFASHFNFAANEHTYIRGGKSNSDLILNDIPNGNVVFGNTAATVGLNTNNYIPPTTLEVRQSNGGIELTNINYPDLPWEWRVVTNTNPISTTFNLYYSGLLKNYFRPSDGALNVVSDERVKTNIEDLGPVMDRIMKLDAVSYMMKDALKGQRRSMGFIAQNVAALFPKLVSHGMPGGDDLMGLDYSGFGVIAIKGIQEEQTQIVTLETGISDIEKRLQTIEKKLSITRKQNP